MSPVKLFNENIVQVSLCVVYLDINQLKTVVSIYGMLLNSEFFLNKKNEFIDEKNRELYAPFCQNTKNW